MRIVFIGRNSAKEYSGGRYHAWMMAEALAAAGHEVCFVTNERPIFHDDFAAFPAHDRVKLVLSDDFVTNLTWKRFDWLFLIPHRDRRPDFFLKAEFFARSRKARMATLSFETPNWFNDMAPVQHDLGMWKHWKKYCARARLIVSSTEVGREPARSFFDSGNEKTRHEFCYPSINDIVADSVPDVEREKRVIVITRFSRAEHKGAQHVSELLSEALRGHALVFLLGAGGVPDPVREAIEQRSAQCGIEVEWKRKLNDADKFRELKRARLMIFPSLFEGFGLPPVEAQYCNLPCIAFDLPVLREVNGDRLHYVPRGDWAAFRRKIEEVMAGNCAAEGLRDGVAPVARFSGYVDRIDRIVRHHGATAIT